MSTDDPRKAVREAKRIVVKVGTSTLTRNGRVRPRKFTDLAADLAALADDDREVVLVSSGSIAIGSHRLGWDHPGRSIPEKQAAAAVGQIGLVELYQRRFAAHDRSVAQVLLTRAGLEDRERFLNARRTLAELLKLGVVPIVNENDTVATDEIRFGDNDALSATIVNLVGADLLVILTDVDGLHTERPEPGRRKPPLISTVDRITPEIENAAGGAGSSFGSGGMITKLQAAGTAARTGATTVLCNGGRRGILQRVAAGEPLGTVFLPGERLTSRKHWLAFTTRVRGRVTLDDGAVRAIVGSGRSLLPAGVIGVDGNFRIGDPVSCIDVRGRELARGLAAYTAEDTSRLMGKRASEIERVLGYSNGDEVIHRDDLVLLSDAYGSPGGSTAEPPSRQGDPAK